MLAQLLVNGLASGCLFALLALGFALIYNTTRIFHVAHGITYTGAAYICYDLLINRGWNLPLAIGAALAGAILLGLAVEFFIYAPLDRKKASTLIALLASLGLYVAGVNALALIFGSGTQILQPNIQATYAFASVTLTYIQLAQIATAVIILPLFIVFLKYSTMGQNIRAVRDNPQLSRVLGTDPQRVRAVVFVLGSVLAGGAAILSALDVGVDPNAGLPALLVAVVAFIIGGLGTFEGPVLGAFLLGVLQSLVVWKFEARWTDAITFGVLILFLLFRPQGILGKRGRVEESTA